MFIFLSIIFGLFLHSIGLSYATWQYWMIGLFFVCSYFIGTKDREIK